MKTTLDDAVAASDRLKQIELSGTHCAKGEDVQLRNDLSESLLTGLLRDAGFRIEGPGTEPPLSGCFWWTLTRNSWGGIECGNTLLSYQQAVGDAVHALLVDEDVDWKRCTVQHHATGDFPSSFGERMESVRNRGR